MSRKLFTTSKSVTVSGVDEVVVGESDTKKSKKENKSLISSAKKEKKKSKEKETRYAHLGDESSGEDENDGKSPLKIKKPKPFMFGSAKKDKEKKNAKANFADAESSGGGLSLASGSYSLNLEAGGGNGSTAKDSLSSTTGEKKKEKKEKHKLKLVKKSKDKDAEHVAAKAESGEELCIFGVPLEVAVERQRCHDGIPLPMVVRLCIDYVEDNGLMLEGIYRSSGVKSKVNKLRVAFNSRTCSGVNLNDYEPAVVASVLKLYIRELPEPVLTEAAMPKFEQVSSSSNPQKRIEGMKQLIASLPEANRALLTWIFVHMGHVIERERFNKMTLQNVSIVLSPTMRISHRVLNCFFENSHILFENATFKKYVPPISSSSANLPETEKEIEEEIRKQESLLADLHLQISSGAASKKTEEQIWEQQRIVTQLKRKLRTAAVKKESNELEKKYEPIDYEEELDFSLRVPSRNEDTVSQASHEESSKVVPEKVEPSSSLEKVVPPPPPTEETDSKVTVVTIQKPTEEVQPQPQQHVTVIKLQQDDTTTLTNKEVKAPSLEVKKAGFPLLPPPPASGKTRVPHSAILKPTPASPPPPSSQAQASATVAAPKAVVKPANNVTLKVIDSAAASSAVAKSKSLPRGLPSSTEDPTFATAKSNEDSTFESNENDIEELQLECLRLKLEFEELMAVKSELEQRKRSEYKEMEDLREEIATMQTLYQYRTYSVDSSESSSDENNEEKDVREEVEELNKVLSDLVRENRELEEKRLQLGQKIQEERNACINLRVQIRLEQERILKKQKSNQQQPTSIKCN